jgi:hypothetical protein
MDDTPNIQPSGALTPPPRVPPIAVAASAPLPPREPSARRVHWPTKEIRGLIGSALDGLDALGERIATAVGLR